MKNNDFDKVKRVYLIFTRENNEKWFRIMMLRARQGVTGHTIALRTCDTEKVLRVLKGLNKSSKQMLKVLKGLSKSSKQMLKVLKELSESNK